MEAVTAVCLALLLIGVILLVAKWIRVKLWVAQSLFLPASVIGGFLALMLGPYVLGNIAEWFGYDGWSEFGLFGEQIMEVWTPLPQLLISVVFATMFLGQKIPSPKRVYRLVGPQLSVGFAYASGQIALGLILAVLVLGPLFDMPAVIGTLIEIGFEGGHGTAAGMAPALEAAGFPEGTDIALGLATIGLLSGIVLGVIFINWAVRHDKTAHLKGDVKRSIEEQKGLYAKDEQYPAALMTTRPASIEPLALHLSFVALAILIGWGALSALQQVEQWLWAPGGMWFPDADPEAATTEGSGFEGGVELLAFIPVFPMAMLAGVGIQLVLDRTGNSHILNHEMMVRIQGLALDILIISALATLSLGAIADNIGPFLILAAAGIIFNVLILVLLVPRAIPEYWFERGIGDFGQSMGVTATGLILMRIADPENKTPALEAFGYKQLLYEPFFGGGLITAFAVPIVFTFGPYPMMIAMLILFAACLIASLKYFGQQNWHVSADPSEDDGGSASSGSARPSPA